MTTRPAPSLEAVNAADAGLPDLLAALDHVGDAVEITDATSRIMYVNPAFERQTGWPREEALGRTPAALFRAGQHTDEFYDAITAELESGNVWRGELTGRRRDGTSFPQHMTVAPVRDAAGHTTHYVAIKRDLTESKQTQAALTLADRVSSLGMLAAGVGHEINNPLSALLGNLVFIRDALARAAEFIDSDPRREVFAALTDAVEAGEGIRDIVADLRSFSRADEANVGPVQVCMAVETAVRLAKNELRHRGTLTLEFEDAPSVWANEARLVQVFLNLLVNAAQALPSDSASEQRIAIRIRRGERGGARVEVSDTGVGISPENLPRIFDAFFTTKPIGVGTGLGLSICHSIVTGLGGGIHATSEPGRGTTFTVSLPPAPRDSTPDAPKPRPVPELARRRILVIDDEPSVGRALRRMLSGHDVTLCGAGDDAVELIMSGAYDGVLCDLMMPDQSGVDIYERVRRDDPALLRRFVFMTGGAFTPQARQFLATVPNTTLRKPFDADALRAALSSL